MYYISVAINRVKYFVALTIINVTVLIIKQNLTKKYSFRKFNYL